MPKPNQVSIPQRDFGEFQPKALQRCVRDFSSFNPSKGFW
ncbi:hypothetical protein CKA32_001433 [Geitlerinema sp. FC II]|nr:hypothetical protein CKA32_001433 [Geitlerinema sp. FC II]